MMKYRVIESYNRYSFVDSVQDSLKEGWELVGGVSVLRDIVDGDIIYFQSLIKEVDDGDINER